MLSLPIVNVIGLVIPVFDWFPSPLYGRARVDPHVREWHGILWANPSDGKRRRATI